MQVPKDIKPQEIRLVIYNGCVLTPEFGSAIPEGVKLRIVEYDTDGILDEIADVDHEGDECLARQWSK